LRRLFPLRSLAAVAAVCALALAVTAGYAGQAKAARGMEIGIQDDAVFVGASKPYYRNKARAYRFARSLGVTRLRVNLVWAYTLSRRDRKAKRKPAGVVSRYGFAGYDAVIAQAAKYGMRVQLGLTGPAPAWATRKRRVGNYKPNSRYFAEFASLAARHFGRRVDRYSIWNEPNWHSWLGPLKSAATLYRSLYYRGYKAIKAANPKARVLIAETAPYGRKRLSIAPLSFLRRVACVDKRYRHRRKSCPRLKADGFAHHPYDFAHSPRFRYPGRDNVTIGTLSRLTKALSRLNRAGALRRPHGGRMPLYLTEYGYFATGHRALKKRTAGRYLYGGFKKALANGRVRSMFNYLLVVVPKHRSYAYFNTGLVNTHSRKLPVYKYLRKFYRHYRKKLKRPGHAIRF
jgi:Cellulase (glycosyl hydrolase family 5)